MKQILPHGPWFLVFACPAMPGQEPPEDRDVAGKALYIPGSSKSWKFHVKSGDYQFFEGLSEKTQSFQTPGFCGLKR